MIRNILIVTVASFFLSVVCLSVAISMAGPELITRGAWGWGNSHWNWGWGWPVHSHRSYTWSRTYSDDGPQATREEPWSGESLEVQIPAEVTFTQADGPAKLVLRGPQGVLDRLHVHDGQIGIDPGPYDGGKVTIELTAPKVTRFALNGTGRLDITGYRQDRLDLRISGDGDMSAQGAAKSVTLDISGSGNADLAALAADNAEVKISGSGQAKVGPKASARLDITGSGDVTLTSHPKHVESHVSGSGTINQDDEETPDPPDQPAKKKSGTSV